jgi:hypothetical protein
VRLRGLLLLVSALGCVPAPSGEGRGVLLVTVERLRADRQGGAGAAPLLAPLDALGGVALTRLWSEDTDSRLAHAGLLTGSSQRMCRRGGARGEGGAVQAALPLAGRPGEPRRSPSLAEGFLASGWATAAFLGSSALDSLKGIERGFHELDPAAPDQDDEGTLARFKGWLDALPEGRDWFAWVHLADLEELPATFDPGLARLEASDTPLTSALDLRGFHGVPALLQEGASLSERTLLARYDTAVRSTATRAARLVQLAREHAGTGALTAAVVGSTGLSLGERGAYLRRSGLASQDFKVAGRLLAPGLGEQAEYAGLMALSDLAPTLLDLAGLSAEVRASMRSPSHAAALRDQGRPPREAPDRGARGAHPAWRGADFTRLPALPILLGSETQEVLGFVDGELFWCEGLFRAGEAEALLGYRPDRATWGDPPRMTLQFAELLQPAEQAGSTARWTGEDELPADLRERVDALGPRLPVGGLWASLAELPVEGLTEGSLVPGGGGRP